MTVGKQRAGAVPKASSALEQTSLGFSPVPSWFQLRFPPTWDPSGSVSDSSPLLINTAIMFTGRLGASEIIPLPLLFPLILLLLVCAFHLLAAICSRCWLPALLPAPPAGHITCPVHGKLKPRRTKCEGAKRKGAGGAAHSHPAAPGSAQSRAWNRGKSPSRSSSLCLGLPPVGQAWADLRLDAGG